MSLYLNNFNKLFSGVLLVLFANVSLSQDTEFSQFDRVPLMQNPANTGMGRGYNRANLMYHSQQPVGGTIGIYQTMYASVDAPIFSHKMKRQSGLIGAGIQFYNNTAGDSKLSTLMAGLSLAAHVDIDNNNKGSVGFQGSFLQNSYSTSAIQWDNQFNGTVYDPVLPSGETYAGNSFINFNLGAGLLWQHYSGETNLSGIDKGSFYVGYGMFNINKPDISVIGRADNLYMRHVLHGKGLFAIGEKHFGISPSGYLMFQGPSKEYSIGASYLYYFHGDTKYTGFIKASYLGFGLHYRNTDAVIPSVTMKFGDFIIGLSYDYSVGKINTYNNGLGGFEISLQFNDSNGTLFNQGNKHVINSSRSQRKL